MIDYKTITFHCPYCLGVDTWLDYIKRDIQYVCEEVYKVETEYNLRCTDCKYSFTKYNRIKAEDYMTFDEENLKIIEDNIFLKQLNDDVSLTETLYKIRINVMLKYYEELLKYIGEKIHDTSIDSTQWKWELKEYAKKELGVRDRNILDFGFRQEELDYNGFMKFLYDWIKIYNEKGLDI